MRLFNYNFIVYDMKRDHKAVKQPVTFSTSFYSICLTVEMLCLTFKFNLLAFYSTAGTEFGTFCVNDFVFELSAIFPFVGGTLLKPNADCWNYLK